MLIQTAAVPNTGGVAIFITKMPDGTFQTKVDGHGEYSAANVQTEELARKFANGYWKVVVANRNDGRTGADLLGGCISIDLPARVEITEGFWVMGGAIYKVQASQSTGHLYAKKASPDGGFDYAPGAMRSLRETADVKPLSQEHAAQFGQLYGSCCLCGRTLTNEASIAAGIGPICAGKQGW